MNNNNNDNNDSVVSEFLNSPEDWHNFWTGFFIGYSDDTEFKDLAKLQKYIRENDIQINGKIKYHYLSLGYLVGHSLNYGKKNKAKVGFSVIIGRYLPELINLL